ncbi:MAG: hypothetical protein GX174_00435 [Lentisphaerae bacterium]|jgi:hypothetical protein|nr:hypothetical protein [Lentisphaerota bacterium]
MLNVQPSCQTNKLLFGVATTDITPPVGVTLMGYDPRISESVGHPLRAEALACANPDGGGWLMVSADVCGFSAPLTRVVRAAIADGTGLDVSAIMIAATHTHSGPHVSDALWCERSELESAYFAELRAKLVDVALRAWNARTPGTLVTAETAAPGFGSNRRARNADGTWYNQWSDPEGTNTGYNDPGIDLVGVRRPDGTLDALLVVFGCHPVSFGSRNLAISGDYVGHLKDALEQSGAVRTAMFSVGGHANVDPRVCVQGDPAVVQAQGEGLAAIVTAALPGLKPVQGAVAAAVREPWEFQTTWSPQGRVSIYFPHAAKGSQVRTGISAWGVGGLAFIGLPGETVSEYRRIFRRRSPFRRTILVSLVNDFIGYLPTDEILTQGAYEAMLSPLSPIQDALTARGDAALARLHAELGG